MTRYSRFWTRLANVPAIVKLILIVNPVLYLFYGTRFNGFNYAVVTVEDNSLPRPANVYCRGCTIKDLQIIMGDDICYTYREQDTDLLVLLFTTHQNVEARNALRETWLSDSNDGPEGRIRHAFLIGRSNNHTLETLIQEENDIHNDIVQGDFVDSYYNLTTKTMLGLKWFRTRCPNAKYILKTDDDVYVNIPGLKDLISTYSHLLETSVAGTCFLNITPDRNVNSKWYVSEEEYPKKTYPGYCSGTGYLLSANAANQIAAVSATVPYFYLEDVYIGFCVSKLGYKFTVLPGFHSATSRPIDCRYKSESVVTSHRIAPDIQRKIWNMPCSVSYFYHYLM
ncbi:hypothetical protein FSP39_007820 [Pinctada imbricata]|uniref:Hexosyltransferase n=1 Tax=Pinctada imbricata TaxID=66713 RepID=A0AA89C4A2_PINIB|nr:hypothetical protein FSP39_007820 [Pinctada imbricata]